MQTRRGLISEDIAENQGGDFNMAVQGLHLNLESRFLEFQPLTPLFRPLTSTKNNPVFPDSQLFNQTLTPRYRQGTHQDSSTKPYYSQILQEPSTPGTGSHPTPETGSPESN